MASSKPSATHQVPVGCEIPSADKHCSCVFLSSQHLTEHLTYDRGALFMFDRS